MADDTEGVRWEHVAVTYVETITRTVTVHVRASEPLTQAQVDGAAPYLVDLAVSTQRLNGDAYRPRAEHSYVGARSVGHEIAGGP